MTDPATSVQTSSGAQAARRSVFISHSSKDKPLAVSICQLLKERGVGYWIDNRDIPAGKGYGEQIIDGIEKCSVFLLLLTPHSNASIPVRNEVETAFKNQKLIVPLRLKPILPSKQIEYYVSNAQWVDAFSTPLKKRIDELVRVVKAVEADEEIPRPAPEQATVLGRLERYVEQAFRHRAITAAVLATAVLALGGLTLLNARRANEQLAAQQAVIDQDPNTIGFVKMEAQPPAGETSALQISAAVYLNAKGATFSGIQLRGAAEAPGHVERLDLQSRLTSGAAGGAQVLSFEVPSDSRRIVVCMTAAHPKLNEAYTGIWSYAVGGSPQAPVLSRDQEPRMEAGTPKACT